MSRKLHLLLAAGALVAPLPAQKLALAVNDNLPPSTTTMATNVWFAVRTQLPPGSPPVVAALEFLTEPTANQTQQQIAIYDQDPATSKPLNQLALAVINTVHVQGWQGAAFVPPVLLQPNQVFFAALFSVGARAPIVVGGTKQVHYWSTTWSGPFTTQSWAYRVYTAGGNGSFANYGAGAAGGGGTAAIHGLGWPNLGNPIGIGTSALTANAAGFLLLGRHIPGLPVVPLGTLYVLPILATAPVAANASSFGPNAYLRLDVPNDINLVGFPLSMQCWFADATTASGLVHTGGLDVVIGA